VIYAPFGISGIPSHFSPGHRHDNSIIGDCMGPPISTNPHDQSGMKNIDCSHFPPLSSIFRIFDKAHFYSVKIHS
jgi:hypothetical protein